MRPKFIFALLLLALLVLGAAFLFKQHRGNPATPPSVNESVTSVPVVSAAPPSAPAPVPAAPVSTNVLTPEQRQTAIDAETDRLQQWSMNDDPASLSNILADLTNPEKDTEEQIALLEAANFLSLPPVDFSQPTSPKTRQ
jgi:cytoskeletal protein RodZ